MKHLMLLALAILTNACSTFEPAPKPLPEQGPTTQEVYNSVAAQGRPVDVDTAVRLRQSAQAHARAWPMANPPHVSNPQLTGYVFPHLTSRGHPVPGYRTVFRLYDREHYALPGEFGGSHK